MRTYKQLQDAVLQWMADESDTGLLLTLVKDALNRAHQNLLNDDRYDFLLWPRTETLSLTAGQKVYTLHPQLSQLLFLYNPTTDEYLEEIAPKGLMESEADWNDGTSDNPDRFMLTGLSKLLTQPSAASVVTVTTTGGTESSANSLLVTGTSNGVVVTETLTSGSAWASLTGSQSFDVITDITKLGASWTRTITITANSQTLLTLGASSYGQQYRTLELLESPSAATALLYRFYRRPRQLVYDNDIPDVPQGFDDILVYTALIAMQGYTRATSTELDFWTAQIRKLTDTLQMTYRATRTMGGRPTYTRYIPRV
ncbi:MAG: hypothetical protein EBS05_16930 [Proteobacteria bacterium]|nr:hypothetical protein [Pseudomonadota bacterium]